MSKYQNFIFKDYQFDKQTGTLRFYYSYDGMIEFSESYTFDFDFIEYDDELLTLAIENLFFVAGVSYFKSYLAPNIVIDKGQINKTLSRFLSKTYEKGLGEFFYINKLDPNSKINFPINGSNVPNLSGRDSHDFLIGIGGGKDSLVTVELLRNSGFNISTWSLGHKPQLGPLVEEIGTEHLWVEREWDRSMLEHNAQGAYNGHVPISAIFACVGTVVAILTGKQQVVVSNENSANEPDLEYKGVQINHQYSKSIEFEKDYQSLISDNLGNTNYFSYLRPFSEVFISEIFAKVGFEKYKTVFSSCNRAFTHQSDHMSWCGECAKCAFTFLALTPFIERSELEKLWHKNLLLDPELEITYRKLLGIDSGKPLDCVGEIKESRAAMKLAQHIYPELIKYKFEIPEDYSYRDLNQHSMPSEIYEQLVDKLKAIGIIE